MIKQLLSKQNLNYVYLQVYRNKGAGGVDKVQLTDLMSILQANGRLYNKQIENGSYQVLPILGIEMQKGNNPKETRILGIPTVVNRVYQQALHQVLQPIFEVNLQEHSYGFRPNRSAHLVITKRLKMRGYLSLVEYYNK